jgi:hypothetical protein
VRRERRAERERRERSEERATGDGEAPGEAPRDREQDEPQERGRRGERDPALREDPGEAAQAGGGVEGARGEGEEALQGRHPFTPGGSATPRGRAGEGAREAVPSGWTRLALDATCARNVAAGGARANPAAAPGILRARAPISA